MHGVCFKRCMSRRFWDIPHHRICELRSDPDKNHWRIHYSAWIGSIQVRFIYIRLQKSLTLPKVFSRLYSGCGNWSDVWFRIFQTAFFRCELLACWIYAPSCGMYALLAISYLSGTCYRGENISKSRFVLRLIDLRQLGCGAIFGPAIGVISHWFKKRRGMALGLTAAGSSIGGTVFPIASDRLIREVG